MELVKNTIEIIIQFSLMMSLISPLIWKTWKLLNSFVSDHRGIREDFSALKNEIVHIKTDISVMNKEFHLLNRGFKDYIAFNDARLESIEAKLKVHDE
jgi:hypothetical protein